RQTLRCLARAGALTVLLDDPPNTWATLARAARALADLGLEPDSIVTVTQTFPSTPPVPSPLREHPLVLLPAEQTRVHRLLEADAVKTTLSSLLAPTAVVRTVKRLPLESSGPARAHASALYEAEIAFGGQPWEVRLVYAQGAGLGYLGAHSLAIGQHLQRFVPTLYGFADGLLFREWLPESSRLATAAELEEAAPHIVDYVTARARALPVPDDVSQRLRGRLCLWRMVGRFLARPFGRARIVAWPLTEIAARRLLRVQRPSVVDGNTGLPRWFRDSSREHSFKKIGFYERTFSGFDRYCYDPVFDLAGAAASSESETLDQRLRALYSSRSAEVVDPERWLLYQLAHLDAYEFEGDVPDADMERRMASRIQRYFGEMLLADIRRPLDGALCGIDIDGVLETTVSGISVANVQGARALRALASHGYRPVIVSGRSADEVRDRCIRYRLAGGVAEYGAAVYTAHNDTLEHTLIDAERETLAAVREVLQRPDVLLDENYHMAVRAYRRDAQGRRWPLPREQVEIVLSAMGGAKVRAVRGQAQTDFMVERVTKATGIEVLAATLGAPRTDGQMLAMAIGDTASDLPMLRLARRSFAPANAEAQLRGHGIRRLRGAYQAGLEEAAGQLLGHRPGSCPTCSMPALTARSQLLLAVLGASSCGSLLSQAAWAAACLAKLAWQVHSSRGERVGLAVA
ncbi:MAG: HAD family hydrolase, partial [Chloroflexota bacterium]